MIVRKHVFFVLLPGGKYNGQLLLKLAQTRGVREHERKALIFSKKKKKLVIIFFFKSLNPLSIVLFAEISKISQ